jgi:hypothetical protein
LSAKVHAFDLTEEPDALADACALSSDTSRSDKDNIEIRSPLKASLIDPDPSSEGASNGADPGPEVEPCGAFTESLVCDIGFKPVRIRS